MGAAGRSDIHRRGRRCPGLARGARELTGDGRPAAPWPLRDLGPVPGTPRWLFAVVAVERTGRVSLPAAARDALGAGGGEASVRAMARGDRLLLRPDGPGRRLAVDGRGRLTLPAWLRCAARPSGSVLVGTRMDAPLVLVAPTSLLDALGDAAAGER